MRIQWIWSNLIGGIHLQVHPEDVETAEELLSRKILPTIELEDGGVYEQPSCTYCNSLDISFEALNKKVGLASILIAVPIPFPKNLWKCHACGKEWENSFQQEIARDSE